MLSSKSPHYVPLVQMGILSHPCTFSLARDSDTILLMVVCQEHTLASLKMAGLASKSLFSQIPSAHSVVLLVDGHSTHINIEISKFCQDNQILLYCLPAHSTQPLDVGFYGPLKSAWKCPVNRFTTDNVGEIVTKENFAQIFRKAWDDCVKVPTIVHSFKHSGIYPVNYDAICSSKTSLSAIYTTSSGSPSTTNPESTPDLSALVLATFESTMSVATKNRFEKGLEEGCDIECDELYNT